MPTERARKDYTDFVCDFGSMEHVETVLQREGITIPEGWTPNPSNFVVTEDNGRTMSIKFWDEIKECSMGEEFEIDYDDAHYWA